MENEDLAKILEGGNNQLEARLEEYIPRENIKEILRWIEIYSEKEIKILGKKREDLWYFYEKNRYDILLDCLKKSRRISEEKNSPWGIKITLPEEKEIEEIILRLNGLR